MTTTLGFSSFEGFQDYKENIEENENENENKIINKKESKSHNKTVKNKKNNNVEKFLQSLNTKSEGFDNNEQEDDDELLTSYDKKNENSDEMLNKGLEQQQEFINLQENFQRMHQERKDELNPFYSELNENIYPDYNNVKNKKILTTSDSDLMKKLNYVVHMLEEQQDEKTQSITEEIILYTFLGIFVIFVVDSFSKATKYKR